MNTRAKITGRAVVKKATLRSFARVRKYLLLTSWPYHFHNAFGSYRFCRNVCFPKGTKEPRGQTVAETRLEFRRIVNVRVKSARLRAYLRSLKRKSRCSYFNGRFARHFGRRTRRNMNPENRRVFCQRHTFNDLNDLNEHFENSRRMTPACDAYDGRGRYTSALYTRTTRVRQMRRRSHWQPRPF